MKTQLSQLASQIQNKNPQINLFSQKDNKGLINQHTLRFYGSQL